MSRFRSIEPRDWDLGELRQALAELEGARVLVVGDVGLDRYTVGSVERISPEAPVPIVAVQDEQHKLGLAANVADNVSALGGEAQLCGVIGRDAVGAQLSKILGAQRISSAGLVKDSSRRTTLKERVVSERQQLLRIDYETTSALSSSVEREFFGKVQAGLGRCQVAIVEDYAKGLLSAAAMKKIFTAARAKGRKVAVDPNARTPLSHYRGAWMLTPNTKEAEALSGIAIQDLESLERAGSKILSETQAAHLVITRGKDGMALFSKGEKERVLIPTTAREVYDVSGAGDTVIAVLALCLAREVSLVSACVLANLAAGVEVGKRGTATVSPEELRTGGTATVSPEELRTALESFAGN